MLIDMKGYKVVYDCNVYKCVAVEPYYFSGPYGELQIKDALKLKVYIIDNDGQFDILDGFEKDFAFLKDEKWGK